MNVSLSLHMRTHHAEGHQSAAILHYKPWNDGVKRPFFAGDPVRVIPFQRKTHASILERDSGSGNDDSRSETHVIGLDV